MTSHRLLYKLRRLFRGQHSESEALDARGIPSTLLQHTGEDLRCVCVNMSGYAGEVTEVEVGDTSRRPVEDYRVFVACRRGEREERVAVGVPQPG